MSTIKYPFGPADVASPAYATTIEVAIDNQETILTLALTGAATLDLTVNDELKAGANLTLIVSSDTTARTLTPGTGFTAPVVVGTINKTNVVSYRYDGSTFVKVSADKLEPAGVQSPAYGATVAVTISKPKTMVNLALAGACTLNLTVSGDVPIGSVLHVKAASDTTARDLTPGTAMTGAVVAGVISKTNMATYVYDGTNFINTSVVQID